ncbi:hypothetical protein MYIN104542_20775 [Mycobacterium intermedium]
MGFQVRDSNFCSLILWILICSTLILCLSTSAELCWYCGGFNYLPRGARSFPSPPPRVITAFRRQFGNGDRGPRLSTFRGRRNVPPSDMRNVVGGHARPPITWRNDALDGVTSSFRPAVSRTANASRRHGSTGVPLSASTLVYRVLGGSRKAPVSAPATTARGHRKTAEHLVIRTFGGCPERPSTRSGARGPGPDPNSGGLQSWRR